MVVLGWMAVAAGAVPVRNHSQYTSRKGNLEALMTDLGMWVRNMKVEHQRLCIANTAEDSSRWIP